MIFFVLIVFLVELVSLLKICRVVVLFVGDWLSLVLLFLSSTSSFVRFVRSSSSSSSSLLCIYIVSTFQRGREHGGGIQMTFTEYYTKITALDMQSFPRFFRRRLYAHRIATNEKTEFKFHSMHTDSTRRTGRGIRGVGAFLRTGPLARKRHLTTKSTNCILQYILSLSLSLCVCVCVCVSSEHRRTSSHRYQHDRQERS
jgi:hypothetical protein